MNHADFGDVGALSNQQTLLRVLHRIRKENGMANTPTASADALLRESEERYRALFDNASDMIQSIRPDGSFEFVNRAWHDTLGYTPEELQNLIIWDTIYPASMTECQTHFMTVMEGTPLTNIRATFMDRHGNPVPTEGSAQARFVDGKLIATHGFFRDITEKLRSEELAARNAQLEREQQARFLEKMAALGKLSAGLSHELNNPSAAAQRAAKRLATSLDERDQAMRALLAGGVTVDEFTRLEGLASSCDEKRLTVIERTPLETSYLAGDIQDWLDDHGVADAWNHAPILVQGGLTTDQLDDLAQRLPGGATPPAIAWISTTVILREQAEVVAQSSNRISDLVGAVKAYSFRDQATVQDVDIHDGLENTIVILAYQLKSMTVERDYDRTLPPIRTYGSGLNQVWTNILDNALDATGGTGTVTIRTRREGNLAVVEITDNGPGIPSDMVSQIFEPFFTTKPQGEGTGLGLDIAWRIVTEEHGGRIEVESEPGRTTFRVAVPIGLDAEEDE